MTKVLIVAGLILAAQPAMAQTPWGYPYSGYTITTPGQFSTHVSRGPYGGGYTVQTPGRLNSYITPNWNGGYTVQTPGRLDSYITPDCAICTPQ